MNLKKITLGKFRFQIILNLRNFKRCVEICENVVGTFEMGISGSSIDNHLLLTYELINSFWIVIGVNSPHNRDNLNWGQNQKCRNQEFKNNNTITQWFLSGRFSFKNQFHRSQNNNWNISLFYVSLSSLQSR